MWRNDWLMSTAVNWHSNHNHQQLLGPQVKKEDLKLWLCAGGLRTFDSRSKKTNGDLPTKCQIWKKCTLEWQVAASVHAATAAPPPFYSSSLILCKS